MVKIITYDTFREWYTNDFQSFVDYNIKDVELVGTLEDKLRLIELILTMATRQRLITDVFSEVRLWDTLIYNHLLKENIHLKYRGDNVKKRNILAHMLRGHKLVNTNGLFHLILTHYII